MAGQRLANGWFYLVNDTVTRGDGSEVMTILDNDDDQLILS